MYAWNTLQIHKNCYLHGGWLRDDNNKDWERKISPDMKHDLPAYTNTTWQKTKNRGQSFIFSLRTMLSWLCSQLTSEQTSSQPFITAQQHKHILHFNLQADDPSILRLVVTC